MQLLNLSPSRAPVSLTCNYITLFFRNIASLLRRATATDPQRFIVIITPQGPTARAGRPRPANGPTTDNHLHDNPYLNGRAPGQDTECEAANEKYLSARP